MANFDRSGMTQAGINLMGKAVGGATIQFTRLVLGDGTITGEILDLKGVVSPKQNVDVTRIERNDNQCTVGGELLTSSVKQGFFWREAGLYAMDPDVGEILYNYAYSTKPDYIAASDSGMMEEILVSMVATVGSNTNVNVTIDDSIVFATKKYTDERLSNIVTIIPNVRPNKDNTYIIQDALDSLVDGGKILIPPGRYDFTCLNINNNDVVLELHSNTILNHTIPTQSGVIVSADNFTFKGGKIISNPVFCADNTDLHYSVIDCKCNNAKIENVTLVNVPRYGISITKGSNHIITNNIILGNYPEFQHDYMKTAQFGIYYKASTVGDGNVIISNNIVETCVQGIFIGDSTGKGHGINISNNIFKNCLDHGVYANGGNGSIIANNNFYSCHCGIAVYGKYAVIDGNTLYTPNTGNSIDVVGISIREPVGCIIKGNVVKGDGQENGVIIDLSNLELDPYPNNIIENNIISDNVIEISKGKVIAINIGKPNMTEVLKNNIIRNNIIKSYCKT